MSRQLSGGNRKCQFRSPIGDWSSVASYRRAPRTPSTPYTEAYIYPRRVRLRTRQVLANGPYPAWLQARLSIELPGKGTTLRLG